MDYLTQMELREIRKIMEDVRDELRKMNENTVSMFRDLPRIVKECIDKGE